MDPISVANDAQTVGDGFSVILHLVGQLAFKWLPATVIVLGNTNNPPTGVGYVPVQTAGPSTVQEALVYMQVAADPGVYAKVVHYWEVWTALSLFISLLLAALIVYSVIRILQIRRHENQKWEEAQRKGEEHKEAETMVRWKRIVEEVSSDSEQNWRLAVLEADIMLGALLDHLGYKGETMGDKMKQITRNNFNTIDLAWEAHRARNKIAHAGLQEPLSAREARRIIGMYEKVFREFKFFE